MRDTPDPRPAPVSILTAHVRALRAFFRRRAPRADADDLVQEVLLGLLSRAATTEIENTEAYVFTVARNVLARHRSSGRALAALELDADALPDVTPSAERWLADKDTLRLALRAIGTMPARTRDVFILHRFGDMTYAAIARRFGISISAVEKHIIAALRLLSVATERQP